MNKRRIIATIALVALVAVLGITLTACTTSGMEKKLEKAGYTVEVLDKDEVKALQDEYDFETTVKAALTATKGLSSVSVIWFKSADDAQAACNDIKAVVDLIPLISCEIEGKIVYIGSSSAVADATK